MSMQQVLSTWKSILPYLQVSLGGWQILKFTPLVGIIQGVIGWLLWPLFPGFFPSYALLRRFPGPVFKKVECVVPTNPAGLTKAGRPDTSYTDFSPGKKMKKEEKMKEEEKRSPSALPYTDFPRPGDDHRPWPCDIGDDDDRVNSNMLTILVERFRPWRWRWSWWTPHSRTSHVQNNSNTYVRFASVPRPSADVRFASVPRPSNATASNTNVEQDRPTTVSMHYLGDDFKLRYDKNELSVNEKMSHYISGIQWARICEMNKKCFKGKPDNKVVFIKGYKDFWVKKGSGDVMTFDEVLDCVIFEKTGMMISRKFEVLPVNLSQQSNEIISKFLNLVGLFFQAKKFSWYFPTIFTVASSVLAFPPVASCIYEKMNMVVCRSLQWIFDKLPYSMRRQVYSLDMWVQNLEPCNDIQFKVVRDTTITVVIGGAAKTNVPLSVIGGAAETVFSSEKKRTFRIAYEAGYLVIEAEYKDSKKCNAILKFTDKSMRSKNRKDRRVSVECNGLENFDKICTFLKCVADTKAGSLISYDEKKKKVVVRSWRESVRHYVEAGLPDVYKVTLHDVTM